MGLAASQARYLALTARKSDLEYQSQTINTRRLQLAYKTAEIAKAYSEGMNNKCIAISSYSTDKTNGDTTKSWDVLDFDNLQDADYMIIGTAGAALDPAPYVPDNYVKTTTTTTWSPKSTAAVKGSSISVADKDAYEVVNSSIVGKTPNDSGIYADGDYKLKTVTSQAVFDGLSEAIQDKYKDPVTETETTTKTPAQYATMTDAEKVGYTQNHKKNASYVSNGGMDLQSLLVSGKAQIVSKAFFNYLSSKGYSYNSGISQEVYAQALEDWENNVNECNPDSNKKPSVIDWRADETSNFKQRYFTEDDPDVLAKYEAETAEVQAQDKILEVEEKNIETQHKAIETEMENVKKVIQKNIEETFKIFS